MESYWQHHAKDATVEEMMLDSNAEELGKEEIPEILSMIPDNAGMDVLELGAGIGRFTCRFAEHCKTVTAVDFIEKFVDKNRELNGHLGNCHFLQADVTKLQQPSNSYDLVFSNWLLMYLEDAELRNLFAKLLCWLRPNGYFFFRESCYHSSGDTSRLHNPTKYREPAYYNQLLQSVSLETDDADGQYVFEVIMCKSLLTYIKRKSNQNQLCWLVHKVPVSELAQKAGCKSIQEFLDTRQYSKHSIRSYELIFGKNFICPGGLESTEEVVVKLNLQPDQLVLDVGCGLGGAAFLMAQKYGAHVTAMDLSSNMITSALERASEYKDGVVQFEVADVTKREFPKESFDVIFSRDTLLHIKDKHALIWSFYRWLKPGGKVLITDYCCGSNVPWSKPFADYVSKRGYHLLPVDQYAQIFRDVGFAHVESEDRTEQFVDMLNKELHFVKTNIASLAAEISADECRSLVQGWKDKLANCAAGDHRWGLFYATKSLI